MERQTDCTGLIGARRNRGVRPDGSRRPGTSRICGHCHRLAGRVVGLHLALAGRRAGAFRLQCRDAGAAVRHRRTGAGAQSPGMALPDGVRRRVCPVLRAGVPCGSHRVGTRPRQQHDPRHDGGDDQHRICGAADPALHLRSARRSARLHRDRVRGGSDVPSDRHPARKRGDTVGARRWRAPSSS